MLWNVKQRFTVSEENSLNMTAITQNPAAQYLVPVNALTNIFRVKAVAFSLNFFDSSAGAYYTFNSVQWAILNDLVNRDNSNPIYYDTKTNLTDLDLYYNPFTLFGDPGIFVGVVFYGGDVVRETGITPGASDLINFTFSICYEPQ